MGAITLAQYAEDNSITYESVRQSVNRYRDQLGDHIFKQGRTQFLDDEAVKILDERRRLSPVVVVNEDRVAELESLRAEVEELRTKLIETQDKALALSEKYIALESDRVLALESAAQTRAELTEARREAQEQEIRANDALARSTAAEAALTAANEEIQRLRADLSAASTEAASYTRSWFGFYRRKNQSS